MAPQTSIALLASGLAALPSVLAGFDPSSKSNVAVYWGQNSFGQGSGPNVQQRLSYYCEDPDIDIIPVAFLNGLEPPMVNFANAGDNCTAFPGNPFLLDCPQLEEDINFCQEAGKTIILSMGGATYTGGGFASADAAVASAQNLWAMFGPEQAGSDVPRPFGSAVVDGFDYDFEATTTNMVPFGVELRRLMDESTASGDKAYYLTAAPQCPYPDHANGEALDGNVFFDFIMIQHYNNYCGIQSFVPGAADQFNFNIGTWDDWAANTSLNPDVKIMLGIPANVGAGRGYTEGAALAEAIQYSQGYSSFAGVMMWDMSQLYANPGFLDEVTASLG